MGRRFADGEGFACTDESRVGSVAELFLDDLISRGIKDAVVAHRDTS